MAMNRLALILFLLMTIWIRKYDIDLGLEKIENEGAGGDEFGVLIIRGLWSYFRRVHRFEYMIEIDHRLDERYRRLVNECEKSFGIK